MDDKFDSIDDFELEDGGFHKDLPNSTAVLILGILSLVTFWAYGVLGLIFSIIALGLHAKDKKRYEANKRAYELSYNSSIAGKTCAIIGLALSALVIILVTIIVIVFISNGARFR